MKGPISVALVVILLLATPAALAAEWAVRPLEGAGCVVESSPESLSDGYQTTSVRIRVDDRAITVVSPSVFDDGFADIGVAVDDEAMVPMDRLADPRTVVFARRYAALVDQFKQGLRARVQLRFWPTWPTTGTHTATFSLMGFTRAHARLTDCQ